MEASEFCQLISAGISYIKDESAASWMREGFQSKSFFLDGDLSDLATRCCNAYNLIKDIVKEKYLCDDPSKATISRYKRAAIISNVVLKVRPFRIDRSIPTENKVFLINEYFAFYLGLHSLLIDFPDGYIDEYKKEHQDIFYFPKFSNGASYMDIVAKEFYFSIVYQNYNILSAADKYFLLLKGFSKLDVSMIK